MNSGIDIGFTNSCKQLSSRIKTARGRFEPETERVKLMIAMSLKNIGN